MQEMYSQSTSTGMSSVQVNKVLRNTYALLALTMVVSAIAAGASIALGIGRMPALLMSLAGIGILWFVLPKVANSSSGIGVVFLFTALMGASLGPMLSHYLSIPNGSGMIMQALGATALVFFVLSGYVLTTGKNFSFMGGFLMVGLVVVLLAALGTFVAGMFGINISGVHTAISAMIVLLMSGFILYDTSQIIHGGQTNYIMATVSLYLNILNLFTSLLHLIGVFGDD